MLQRSYAKLGTQSKQMIVHKSLFMLPNPGVLGDCKKHKGLKAFY